MLPGELPLPEGIFARPGAVVNRLFVHLGTIYDHGFARDYGQVLRDFQIRWCRRRRGRLRCPRCGSAALIRKGWRPRCCGARAAVCLWRFSRCAARAAAGRSGRSMRCWGFPFSGGSSTSCSRRPSGWGSRCPLGGRPGPCARCWPMPPPRRGCGARSPPRLRRSPRATRWPVQPCWSTAPGSRRATTREARPLIWPSPPSRGPRWPGADHHQAAGALARGRLRGPASAASGLPIERLVHDGGMNLEACASKVQRCRWHLVHQLNHYLWQDGMKVKQRRHYQEAPEAVAVAPGAPSPRGPGCLYQRATARRLPSIGRAPRKRSAASLHLASRHGLCLHDNRSLEREMRELNRRADVGARWSDRGIQNVLTVLFHYRSMKNL